MGQATQLAALRQELRAVFPSSIPSRTPGGGWMRSGAHSGLSTGQRALDQLLNGQGLPRGRITEVTGAPSSGRTALLLSAVAETTRARLPVAWVDPARAFHPPAAAAAGVVLERLLLVQPADLTGAFRAADILMRGQAFSLVVIDLASERFGEDSSAETGLAAGTALARLNGLCALGDTALVFLTSPKTSRDALRYYASLRLETCREDAAPARAPTQAPVLHALGGGAGRQGSADTAPGGARGPGRPMLALLSGRDTPGLAGSLTAPAAEEPGKTSSSRAHTDRAQPDRAHTDRAQPDRAHTDRAQPDRAQPDRAQPDRAQPDRARPRLVGLPAGATLARLRVQVLKNKLGPPGGSCEVALDGGEAHRLPLHPGLPDSSPST